VTHFGIRQEEKIEYPDMVGKIVAKIAAGKNDYGYDICDIRFTDGSFFIIKEEGQCGEFSITRGRDK
jgi:hypothetical protein